MNLSAVYHIPKSNFAFAYRKNILFIRIRVAKDDMESIHIIYGIKYDWQNKQRRQMEKVLSDSEFDYYEYQIKTEDTRIGYYFELNSDQTIIYYTEAGFVETFNDEKAYCYFFQYPYINEIDVHKVPKWVSETNFYQIFVERFYNGNPNNSPPNLDDWDAKPTPTSFMGGDLEGIIKKIDYLKKLGIRGIYLTPIFKSVSNHKYDTSDYLQIDPYFGDEEVLHELIRICHENNIKVVLDAVFNHCGIDFKPFQDVIKNGRQSKYFDWFFVHGDQVEFDPINFEAFGYVPYMPKLNTSNEEVKKYLYKVGTYWAKEFDIDGWRLDVSDEIDHEFWRGFRKKVKRINRNLIIIGENWHNAYPWLQGDQFDGVMNYSLTKLMLDYFATGEIDAKTFSYEVSTLLVRYSKQVNEAMLNLLDSHDTERFLTTCKGDIKKLKCAAAFLYAYIGMPCTYYGTEIGMDGVYDPGCRKGFDWNPEHWNHELVQFYKKIIKLRNEEDVFKYGELRFIYRDDVFIMKRFYKNERIFIVINLTDGTVSLDKSLLDNAEYDLLTEQSLLVNDKIAILPKTAHYVK